jgi:peptidoglycan/xylan/chitin deacetylase (PgdA/CDA1 family)
MMIIPYLPGKSPAGNRLMDSCSILTYHSQNISGHDTADNDHVALVQDLERLDDAGIRIIPLGRVVDWLEGNRPASDIKSGVCLTFDDGCDFDVRDLDWPGMGLQRSFRGIMQDFIQSRGKDAQPGLHATSFVIASSEARKAIDSQSLFNRGWISDDWWRETENSSLMSIASHGWDHNHPDLVNTNKDRGAFFSVDSPPECERQVLDAAQYIHAQTGTWPDLFAYPYGESSAFLRNNWFPQNQNQHRHRAALGTDPAPVTAETNIWNVPRFICGRDWHTPDELIALVQR